MDLDLGVILAFYDERLHQINLNPTRDDLSGGKHEPYLIGIFENLYFYCQYVDLKFGLKLLVSCLLALSVDRDYATTIQFQE